MKGIFRERGWASTYLVQLGHGDMIMEITADFRGVNQLLDPMLRELLCRPNAGEHKYLRCADGTTAKNHLSGSGDLSTVVQLHPFRNVALQQNPTDYRVRKDSYTLQAIRPAGWLALAIAPILGIGCNSNGITTVDVCYF